MDNFKTFLERQDLEKTRRAQDYARKTLYNIENKLSKLDGNPEGSETILGEAVYCLSCGWRGHAQFKPEVIEQIENQMGKGTKRKASAGDPRR